MSTKRDKELARAKWERQQVRRAAKAQQQSVIKRSVLAGLVVIGIVAYAVANKPASNPVASPSKSATSNASNVAGCQKTGPLNTTPKLYKTAPLLGTPAKNLVLNTNCGRISLALDAKAPATSNVMTHLAKDGYFDMTACHRLTTSGFYVLQCGDPTGTGTGNPGFKFADENLPKATSSSTYSYNRGTIAMANGGPGTNGSQFFIVYNKSPLPPNYSIWGHVTSGLDVVDRIAAAGVQGGGTDGKPNANVVIKQALAQ
ncbi:MAG: peptidylprolyl isomerase [Actinobacteria bacterium]|nr:peptidylprolyl isomerase [Actinomycetota bacterium]